MKLAPWILALTGTSLFAAAPAFDAEPLNSRSGDGQTMRFTAIPAEESGLTNENPYDERSMWAQRYTEFQGGAIGTGLAAGDVDGDGWTDLYVVNKVRPNQLFRQVAPFQFEDVTATAGVAGGEAWQTGATLADIDNDGDLDLYVCQFDAPNQLFINDGTGAFTEEAAARGVDLVSSSVVGAFADYDRDGHLDLFVVTNVQNAAMRPDGEPDVLYLNNGDGTFTEATAAAGIATDPGRGHSATWFDANDDGWPDLYVANDFAVPDYLYQNNGDGTFTNTSDRDLSATPWFSMGSDYGDINNDGLTDLFVADMAGTTHFKSKVTMGDMGGQVDAMDLLDTPQYMRNHLFLNTGTDRFVDIAQQAGVKSSDWSWSPRFVDLDNDGWLDLHVTNGMVRSFIDSDLVNETRRLQSKSAVIRLMKNSPPLEETALMFRNDGHLHFKKVQSDWGLDHTAVSFGSVFADFDRDGDLDLAYVNFDQAVSLYRNDSPRGNRLVLALEGTTSNTQGVGTKVTIKTNQGTLSRHLGVARGALSSSEPVLHFGLGDTEQVDLNITWPSGREEQLSNVSANQRLSITETPGGATGMAVFTRPADDGKLKHVAGSHGLDFVNHERRFNDMLRQSLLPNRMNTLGGGIAIGDADGDDDPDVFFAGGSGQVSALYLNDGKGAFTPSPTGQPWEEHGEFEHMSPLWFDLDGDGDNDLLVSSGGTEADAGSEFHVNHLYLNDGNGRFTLAGPEQMDGISSSSSVVTAADYDRDGDLDVFIGGRVVPGEYPVAPESQLLENRDGRLVDVTPDTLRTLGMITAALWSDVDGDGSVDLLITGEWMAPVVYSYDGAKLVENTIVSGFAEQSGWWNSLLAHDYDADGDIDYLAGNAGNNTKYHASHDHPVSVFYADFEGTGTCEIVEAKYEGDNLFPVRGRSCSSRAMPSIAEKFPTFRDFGAALLPEIYTEDKLNEALQVSVTQLESGAFINEGNGRYEFVPFPPAAQTSPIFGLAVAQELVLGAQNFHGPQVETGWFNGGISTVFRGTTVMTAQESGVAIPGEARGAVSADFDGDGTPELLVTRINEPALLYEVRSPEAFAVKLRGLPGNANAIGSRILLRYANGDAHAAEIAAGSGYLSQSQPIASFTLKPQSSPEAWEITWPDGTQSTHAFSAGQATTTLNHPATEGVTVATTD